MRYQLLGLTIELKGSCFIYFNGYLSSCVYSSQVFHWNYWSKLKRVCSRYASLLQFCSKFMSVLQCLGGEQNHHFVMAITRRQTELHHLGKYLQAYAKNLIPYVFKFIREQYEAVVKVKVLSQQISSEITLSGSRKTNQELHLASIIHPNCSFFTCMSLPCKLIFKVCEVVNLPAWNPRKYETLSLPGKKRRES